MDKGRNWTEQSSWMNMYKNISMDFSLHFHLSCSDPQVTLFFPFFWYKCYFFYFESWNPFILNGHSTRHVFPKATVCFLPLSNCFPQSIADMDCEIVTINLVRQMLFLLLLQNSIHHSLCCFISNNILPLELQEVTPNPTVSAMLAGKRHICTWICTIEY